MALLRRKDAMGYTTVVAAPEGASLGERYAAVASAVAIGERVRDQGGHALVVIDDLACMVRAFPHCQQSYDLATQKRQLLHQASHTRIYTGHRRPSRIRKSKKWGEKAVLLP